MLTDEQKRAIMHDKGNILVSASAGSGKTFVMIERLIRLIVSGVTTVDKVLAVTFTNLAAAEMKTKLMDALVAKLREPELDEQAAMRIREQLGEVPSAAISTFHSFCNDLIKAYFYELGLDASFKIADETQAGILKSKAIDRVLEGRYAADSHEFKRLLKTFIRFRSDRSLKELVLDLHEFFGSEAYPSRAAQQAVDMYSDEGYEKIKAAFFAYYRRIFDKTARRAQELNEDFISIGYDKQAKECELVEGYSGELLLASDIMEMARSAVGMTLGRMPSTSTPDEFTAMAKAGLEGLRKRFSTEQAYIVQTFASTSESELKAELCGMRETAEQLVALCFDFDREYASLKREENVVDFADLEHFTLELLEREDIRTAVSARYEYIFADEYQDTNGVQEEILLRVSRDNLFMVGDVKQSIYAFRGCNPTIFSRKFERFERGEGTAMSLTANFRSSSGVLDCVNRIFGDIMTEETADLDYKKAPMRGGNGEQGLAQMHVVKPDAAAKSPVKHAKKGVYSVKSNIGGNVDDEISSEGVVISALIKKAMAGTVSVKDAPPRPMAYSDIVVLTRSVGEYTAALAEELAKNDIPVTAERKKQMTVFPEIRTLIALLRVLDCARQDIALCSVMRGPIGGFTDGELAEIRAFFAEDERVNGKREDGSFVCAVEHYIGNGEGELSKKLCAFLDDIERWRVLADYNGAGEILSTVVREKNLDLFYAAAPDGEGRIKRIDKFINDACAGERPYTVSEYLDRLDSVEEEKKSSETAGGDSVRIMSIHASKGLEFPVVIVCGLNRLFNAADSGDEVLKDREFGIALKTYDTENMRVTTNIYREFLKRRFKEARVKEEMRVLYVALTRAKNTLYLTQTRKNAMPNSLSVLEVVSANCYSKLIPESAAEVFEYTSSAVGDMCVPVSPREVIASASDDEIESRIAKNLGFKYSYNTDLPAKSSVTAILNEMEEQVVPTVWPDESHEIADEGARDAAIKRGNAYHRVMELLDFNKCALSQITEQKQAFVDSERIKKEDAVLVDERKICEILKDDFFRMDEARYFRELPFEVLVPAWMIRPDGGDDEVLVQGVIDLIAFTDKGMHVADYKVSGRSAEALKGKYSAQLELYSFAAERIMGMPVLSKRLYNLSTGEKIEG